MRWASSNRGQTVIRPIVFHGLADALAVATVAHSLGRKADLITAPGAAAYMGPLFFKALVDEIDLQAQGAIGCIVYDCGRSRGQALAALHGGLRWVCIDDPADCPALADVALKYNAEIIPHPAECLALDYRRDISKVLSIWLEEF